MKIFLLSALLCIGVFCKSNAQTAANFYNKGKYLSDLGNKKQARMAVFNKIESAQIIELFKSAAENYLNAKNAMPGLKYLSNYNAAINLYDAAAQYHAGGNDAMAYTLLKQVVELWPALKDIPVSAVTKEKSIFLKGYIYTFPAATIEADWFRDYYETRYLYSIVAKNQGQNDEARQYACEVAADSKEMPENAWECGYAVAQAFHNEKKNCDAAKFALVCIENASKIQPKDDGVGLAAKNAMIDEMTSYLVLADSEGCLTKDMLEQGVVSLASMQGKWTPKAKYAYALGEKVFNEGVHSFGLLFNEYRLARVHNDPDISETWRLRMIQYGKNFSSEEWKTLAAYYGTLSYTEAMTDALDNAKRKAHREHSSVLIGIEPTCIPLGQFAGSIAYQGEVLSHEIRFGFIPDGIKPYLKSGSDTEKVPLYLLTHYSGYQLSYSMKILTKGETPNSYSYIGAELRYTNRNYSDSITYYKKTDKTESTKADLNPKAVVYDACLIFGGIIKGKFLYMDVFGGVGVGYRALSFNSTFDAKNYAVANAPFKAELWNNLYIPIRVGVKVGFKL